MACTGASRVGDCAVPDETSEPDYRRNPARDVEQYAIGVVRAWVGNAGTVVDQSATGKADFWIDYRDGRCGVGEVGWHADPVIQAMWGNMFRRDEHQVVRLPNGQGQWGVRLDRTARIKPLDEAVRRLATTANDRGVDRVDRDYLRPDDPLLAAMLHAGIEYMLKSPGDNDTDSYAIFFVPSVGDSATPLPASPEVVVDWVDHILTVDPAYADLTTKLSAVPDVDERHVFLMSGSATPPGVDHRLQRLAAQLPERPPAVPAGISHVWVASQWRLPGHGGCALWTAAAGWTLIPDAV